MKKTFLTDMRERLIELIGIEKTVLMSKRKRNEFLNKLSYIRERDELKKKQGRHCEKDVFYDTISMVSFSYY